MRVDEFDFDLPEDRIALHPARPRDAARLLHVTGDGALHDHHVHDLPALLRPGDMLVLNDTKVIRAQLKAHRPSRDATRLDPAALPAPIDIDVTLHKRLRDTKSGVQWRAFIRPAKRVRAGDRLHFDDGFFADVAARDGAEATLAFPLDPAAFDTALARVGAPPLPPYIARKRAPTPDDAQNYQTIYADKAGSVAAPTAGLHFTEHLFDQLARAAVDRETVTLHVGAGTFIPVSAADTAHHVMHAEWGEITPAQADRLNAVRNNGGRLIAVGTTALRLLESAAGPDGAIQPFTDETDIFITPGYDFRAVDALMTNFHLPRSTLFMLVCALSGIDVMKRAYAHAIQQNYRFYSFGDASLLERRK